MTLEKILIVEDDPTLQRVLRDNFEFAGYEVSVADDGRIGWQAVQAFKPDLIILDIMMPEVNGFDLCRRIRKDKLETPIIMLTAKGQESDIVLGLNVGADDFVTKPFSIDVLLARAAVCLRRHSRLTEQDRVPLESVGRGLEATSNQSRGALIGQCLAHFQIIAHVGEGGMGQVYRAQDTRLKRDVALKVLPPQFASDKLRLERFRREAIAVAALNHPNIVTIYSIEETNGLVFLTMELVEGRPLGSLIASGKPTLEEFLDLAVPLTDALMAAHAKGIIHRDLKPGNIMIGEKGRLKVLDFGLAKFLSPGTKLNGSDAFTEIAVTQPGSPMGTMAYMSPEQVEGKATDHTTDLFSFGIILFEMLTGERPFSGSSAAALLSSILRDPPRPICALRPDLPPAVIGLIEQCLAKNPALRISSAQEARDILLDVRRATKTGNAFEIRKSVETTNGH